MSQIFLCIGAPRSGTTWLYANLRSHPDVFLPPVKELRHFLGSRNQRMRQAAYDQRMKSRDISQEDKDWLKAWVAMDPEDDEEYCRLLNMTDRSVAGDISPIYSTAGPKQIRRIRNALPENTKVIYIVRNPVDRDWSHMKFTLHRQKKVKKTLRVSEYMSFLSNARMKKRSQYTDNIKRWQNVFPEESILVTFFDKILADPDGLLGEVCEFIGVEHKGFAETVNRKVNRADTKAVGDISPDPAIKRRLARRHLPMLEEMATRYPDPCADWLQRAKDLAEIKQSEAHTT